MVRLYALVKRIKSFRKSHKKEEKLLMNQYLSVQEVVAYGKIYGTVDGVTFEAFIIIFTGKVKRIFLFFTM